MTYFHNSLVALLLALHVFTQNPLNTSRTSTGNISGYVVDGTNGLPIPDAEVLGDGVIKPSKSDRTGKFTLNAKLGSQMLYATKKGYKPREMNRLSRGTPVYLDSEGRLDGVIIKLFPSSLLTGRVVDDKGSPLSNAEVSIYYETHDEAGVRVPAIVTTPIRTDGDGEFTARNLPYGEYFIEVRPPTIPNASGRVFAPIYYPGMADRTKAQPIRVEPGSEVRLPSVSVVASKPAIARIRLYNQTAELPKGKISITFYRAGQIAPQFRTIRVEKDAFEKVTEVSGLLPGKYVFRASFAGSPSMVNEGSLEVELGEGVTNLQIPVRTFEPWKISGTATALTLAGVGYPVSGLQLALIEIGPKALPIRSGLPSSKVLTSDSVGSFRETALLPWQQSNSFRVSVQTVPPGLHVTELRGLDERNELHPSSGRISRVTVVLSEHTVLLEGRILDSSARAVFGASVVLVPDDPREVHRLVKASSNDEGRFKLNAGPGAYHLYAWRYLEGAAYLNPEFLKLYRDKALPIVLQTTNPDRLVIEVMD